MSDNTKYGLEYLIDTDGFRSSDECRTRKRLSVVAGSSYNIDLSYSRVLHLNLSNSNVLLDIINLPENDSVLVFVVMYNSYYTFRNISFASGIHSGLWVTGQMPENIAAGAKTVLRITSNGTSKNDLVIETLQDNQVAKIPQNGYLYNWYAVNSGKLDIPGYRIATRSDFWDMYNSITPDLGTKLKAADPLWNGTDNYGFKALNSGMRGSDGSFNNDWARFWTDSPYSVSDAYYWYLVDGSNNFQETAQLKKYGHSVRLLRNGLTGYVSGEKVFDIDGNIYDTIRITASGYDEVWLKQNLATTRFNDGTGIPFITTSSVWSTMASPGMCSFDNNLSNVFQT